MQPEPIPPQIEELFDWLMTYAESGNLGVVSTLDRETGNTRFTLIGRHWLPDGGIKLVPLGFLSTTAGEEVIPPGLQPSSLFVLAPERWDEFIAHSQAELDRWADDGGAHD